MTTPEDSGTQNESVQEIERDIERTRGQLAETVEALAYKADVPARAKEKATAVKDRVTEKAQVARDRAQETALHTSHVAREKATQTSHAARATADRAVHSAQETPPGTRAKVAAGAVAVVAAVTSVWLLVRRRKG